MYVLSSVSEKSFPQSARTKKTNLLKMYDSSFSFFILAVDGFPHQNFPDVPPWLLPEELVCVELPPDELPLELDTTLDATLDATSTSEF